MIRLANAITLFVLSMTLVLSSVEAKKKNPWDKPGTIKPKKKWVTGVIIVGVIVGIPVVAAIAVAYVRWEYKRRKISRKDKEEHIPLAKAERGQGVGDNNSQQVGSDETGAPSSDRADGK